MPAGDTGASVVQDDLVAVAGILLNLQRQYAFPGFAGVVADVPAASLSLYWTDGEPLPPPVEQVVSSPGRPITVERRSAAYGTVLLNSRADRLTADASLSSRICGLLHRLEVPEEGYGLKAAVQPWPGFHLDQASSTLTAVAGVPVTVEVADPAVLLAPDRQKDAPPWSGGAHLTSDGKNRCSSGFGAVRTVNGLRYLLSAAHCFKPDTKVFNGPQATWTEVGTVRDHLPGFDSELIEVKVPAVVSHEIYSGAWNAGDLSGVGGADRVVKGTVVCASGAMSGRNCGQLVVATDVRTINPKTSNPWQWKFDWISKIFVAQTIQILPGGFLAPAVGAGDSGGPVVRFDKDGKVRAQGTISAGSYPTLCGNTAVPTTCYSTGLYADINNLIEVYGITL